MYALTQQEDRLISSESASISGGTNDGLPGCYLIVHNVSKRQNIGTLIRSAAAFGVTEVPGRSVRLKLKRGSSP